MKKITVFFIMMVFANVSYSLTYYHHGYASDFYSTDASSVCLAILPTVKSSYPYFIVDFGHFTAPLNCVYTLAKSPQYQINPSASTVTYQLAVFQCSGQFVNGTCVLCPQGQVQNPYSGQCQQPCPAANTDYSQFESKPGEAHPGSFCVSGCAVRSEIVVDICGAISLPGAECAIQGNFFSYTGEMCGGNNPPPTGPQNPPGCSDDKDRVGDLCLPKCQVNAERGPNGQCQCVQGNYMDQGQCMPEPSCDGTKELYNHQCVERCGSGETRAENGQCVPGCPAGNGLVNGQCVPVNCPSGQHLEGGQCVDNPRNPNCGQGEISDQNGQCIPNCNGGALVNGQCVTPTCPDGQAYSETMRKCVAADKPCLPGTHKEGLNCVSDNPPEVICPSGSHKSGDVCVSDTPPGPGCPSGSTYVNGRCESNQPPTASCPAGQHKNGNTCVSDEPPKDSCPVGQTLQDGQCTGDPATGDPPTKTCPAGQTLSGNVCVGPDTNGDGQPDPTTDAPLDTCTAGKVLKEGKCVTSIPATKTCPEGQTLNGDQCISTNPPIKTCPTGQTLVGEKCVLDSGPITVCPSGQTKVGNECVLNGTPGGKCPTGQTLIGNKCVVGTGGTTGNGNGDGNGNGSGECDPATQECGTGGGGTPPGPIGTLYEKKGRSFSEILNTFTLRVQSAPIVRAGSSFFAFSSVSAPCSIWVLPASHFYPSISIDFQCSAQIAEGFRIAGIVFLLVCAWFAFRIAIL